MPKNTSVKRTARPDRRVQRTRGALRDALISLLHERGWDDVTVRDICDRANIGRSTFYLQFRSKEELLEGGFADLRAALSDRARHAASDGPGEMRFVRGLIEHVDEQRKLFRSLIGRRSGYVVRTRFAEMLGRLVEDDLSEIVGAGWRRDAASRYLAGAFFEVLTWWADSRSAPSAEQVERFIERLTRPVLAQLKKG